jgi:hypothetical protein
LVEAAVELEIPTLGLLEVPYHALHPFREAELAALPVGELEAVDLEREELLIHQPFTQQ